MKKKTESEFEHKDIITGRKSKNPLNKIKLSKEELDEIFLE